MVRIQRVPVRPERVRDLELVQEWLRRLRPDNVPSVVRRVPDNATFRVV